MIILKNISISNVKSAILIITCFNTPISCSSSPSTASVCLSSSMAPGLQCINKGCANGAVKGGVCATHSARTKRKRCSREGCANGFVKGGVCITHGATTKRCSHEGCPKKAQKGGVCITHGARVKRCSHEGCPNLSRRGGVCITHGARVEHKLCSHKGCAKQVQKGGLCRRHGLYSIAAATQNGASRPPHPAGGYDARAFVASAIAGGGGGGIEIDTRNLQSDVSCAAAPRSPSLSTSIMVPNFYDDNEEIIGAWIWRSSRMARLGSANNTNGAS